jgi:glycosyltransferase involved in cell wall biosynthesis
MVRALEAADIPTGLVNVPLAGRMADTSMVGQISNASRHGIALSIFGATDLASFARRTCRGQTNIAYPFWELPTFPAAWKRRFEGFDAYWAPSTFIKNALLEFQHKPVHLIPQPVLLPESPPQPQNFTAPLKFYTFFDFASFMARKNPMGAIHAFRAAFPRGTEDVKLVVKARGNPSEKDREELHAYADTDPRIEVVERLFTREEMTELMDTSNVFISLHRSEGFGLGCAEALARGKTVVATDFGGTCDFITAKTGYPVSYKLVALKPDDYPRAKGSHWAEPDIEHAANILQEIYAAPEQSTARSVAGFKYLQQRNSFEAVGREIRKTLATL